MPQPNEVANDPTHNTTAAEDTDHLESIDSANFMSGYRAYVKSINTLYVLDKDSLDPRTPASGPAVPTTVLWTKNSYGDNAIPGRWIEECTFCPGGTGVGPTGPEGPTGPAGGIAEFANFFALMPGDNAATVAIGGDVDFPQDGPTSGGGITRLGVDSFNLATPGVYEVDWQVSVTEPGQLALTLNGLAIDATRVGRATGTSQLVGLTLITVTVPNSVLTVRNSISAAALTITPIAGGQGAVSATLTIKRLS